MKRMEAWNQPHVHAMRLAKAQANRVAAPAPAYPVDHAPGAITGDWIGGCVNGVTVIYALSKPLPTRRGVRPRCDQHRVMHGGKQISPAMGLTDAMDLLRAGFAPAMSRKTIAAIQECYTPRDLEDAAAA